MNFVTLTPTVKALHSLDTEIMFSVASARAREMDFVKIDLSEDNEQKIMASALKLLKTMKKQGRIQLFVDSAELHGSSTEAQYLANKYPETLDAFKDGQKAIIVKI